MKRPSALVPVIAGFSVMLILMAAVTAIGVNYVRVLSGQLTAIVAERNEKAELATVMRAIHEARYQSLMLASTMHDPFMRDEELMRFSRMAHEFIAARDKFLTLPLDEQEFSLWRHIRDNVKHVESNVETALALLQLDQLDDAQLVIKRRLLPAQETMMAEWQKLVALQRGKNQEALNDARYASTQAQRLTLTLSAGAFFVGLGIAIFVVRLSRRLEKDLFEEKERAQVTLQAIGDAVIRFDTDSRIRYLNPVAEQLLGIQQSRGLGQALEQVMKLFNKEDRTGLNAELVTQTLAGERSFLPPTACLESGQGMEYEVEGSCAPIHTPEGDIMGGVLVLRDVTEARELHRKLLWQADHDGLTGLMNRRAFEDKVSRTMNSKRSNEFPLSLLFIDLDKFKPVNDTAGHAAGDELLRQLSRVMLARIRDTDLLARMGGDEFAVVLTACPNEMAERIAHLIKDSIGAFNFVWEGRTYQVGASIGVVHVPPTWATLDECLAAADAACYQAKQSGRGAVIVHGKLPQEAA